jgi:ABC-type lipoprotein export system ATPase subunit
MQNLPTIMTVQEKLSDIPLDIEAVIPQESITTILPSSLSFREVNAVDVRVKDLSVLIDTLPPLWQATPSQFWSRIRGRRPEESHKTILNEINAHLPAGSLTAIIGSSGSGKTSLLNVMAGRVEAGRLKISGSTTFNGIPSVNKIRSAYVMQQDILIPTLTVRETLQYSADLRLSPPITKAERRAIVEQVILELGLKECADTKIGNNAYKGCSGGEKRRTSIGVQMLANPSVLFCDEPTTGMSLSRHHPREPWQLRWTVTDMSWI